MIERKTSRRRTRSSRIFVQTTHASTVVNRVTRSAESGRPRIGIKPLKRMILSRLRLPNIQTSVGRKLTRARAAAPHSNHTRQRPVPHDDWKTSDGSTAIGDRQPMICRRRHLRKMPTRSIIIHARRRLECDLIRRHQNRELVERQAESTTSRLEISLFQSPIIEKAIDKRARREPAKGFDFVS